MFFEINFLFFNFISKKSKKKQIYKLNTKISKIKMSFYGIYFEICLLLLIIPKIFSQNVFPPFYQTSRNNFWDWSTLNGKENYTICYGSNQEIHLVFGGPSYFNLNTVISQKFISNQKVAAFYQLNLTALVLHPNYSEFVSQNVFLKVLIDDVELDKLEITNPLKDYLTCSNLIGNKQYYLSNFTRKYPLSNYNKSNFEISLKMELSSTPVDLVDYNWGFTNLTIDLFECDSSLCSSCSMLPRNCTTFCSIRCKTCSFNDSNFCTSCFEPNTLYLQTGKCYSASFLFFKIFLLKFF